MTTRLPFRFGLWLLLLAVAVPLHVQAAQTDRIIIKVADAMRGALLTDAARAAGRA